MRILLLAHAFNSLTQRLWCELSARGHALSVEFDIADSVTEDAVALFRPDLISAPYLRRAIPESVWRQVRCLVVHPGPPGDRGPSALDHAILRGEREWGVTVLEAEAEMDAGPVWASAAFALRAASKGSLYRHEVTEAAVCAVLDAVARVAAGDFVPQRPDASHWQPLVPQAMRAIDWARDDTATVLAKVRSADGFPGVADVWLGEACRIFDAWPEARLRGTPGDVIGRRENALLRATTDGAVWIGHIARGDKASAQGMRRGDADGESGTRRTATTVVSNDTALPIKLPATLAFGEAAAALPELPLPGFARADHATWQDIWFESAGEVGFLHFDCYNGAMSTRQCERLAQALVWAKAQPVKVLVLMGGADFWSNGIHLNVIEAASLESSAADESMRNIEAMDDLTLALIESPDQITIAAVGANAGAGGAFLARAADLLWLRAGVLLNPHYKNMGNLYGSEYWTYLLPRRVGAEGAARLMHQRLPLDAAGALGCGFADAVLAGDRAAFRVDVARRAAEIAAAADFAVRLAAKRAQRVRDEAEKPLAAYRAEELAQMRRNFYGFDPSYHVARYRFVTKAPVAWTPRHLAHHREPRRQAGAEQAT